MNKQQSTEMPTSDASRHTRREFVKRTTMAGLGVATASTLGGTLKAYGAGSRASAQTLRAVIPGSAQELPIWKQVVAGFKKTHPTVTMDFIFLPQQTWGAFFAGVQTRLIGGEKYDLVNIPTEGQRLFASKGVIEPLDAYISHDKSSIAALLADIDPKVLTEIKQHSSPNGQTYYLPYGFNTMTMWYYKPLFQAAGVPFPANNWTWNDFLHAAERIAKPSAPAGKQVYAYNFKNGIFAGLDPWLSTNGASLLNTSWSAPAINSPRAIEALQFQRMMVARKLVPTPGGQFDEPTAMAQGRLAMAGCGWWYLPNFQALHDVSKFGMAPWPRKTQQGSPVGYGAIAMFKQSQNKELAWEFIKYMLSTPVQETFARTAFVGGAQSIRRSVATGPIARAAGPTGYANLYDALEYATIVEGITQYNTLETNVDNMYQQILVGNVSPASGLQQLSASIQPILS